MNQRVLSPMHLVLTALSCLLMIEIGHSMPQGLDADQRSTATVSGTVLEQGTGRPVRLAIVTAVRDSDPRVAYAVTDENGRFVIDGLSAGRYRLASEKSAFVQPRKMPLDAPSVVVLRAGERIVHRPMYLQRGAVLTGIVRTPAGAPLNGATITLLECVNADAPCTFTFRRSHQQTTDIEGRYRFFGIEPGNYVIAADARLSSSSTPAEAATPAAIDLAEKLLRSRSDTKNSSFPVAATTRRAYITTYYPGTTNSAGAARLNVAAGQEVLGDFAIEFGTPAVISGFVVQENGQLIGIDNLSLFPTEPATAVPPSTKVFVARDGSFTTAAIPPGRYRLVTTHSQNGETSYGISQNVDITGADVEGLRLVLRRTLSVSGRASIAKDDRMSELSGIRIDLKRADLKITVSNVDASSATLDSTGMFNVTGLMPGRYSIEITLPAVVKDKFWPVSALIGGRDALDSYLDVGANLKDLHLLFAPHLTSVSGVLSHKNGTPAPEYSITVFPRDEELRSAKRRVQTVPVGFDGLFQIKDLPPGEYLVAAMGVLPGDEVQPTFLNALVSRAVPLIVTQGAPQNLVLNISE
jgi:hypothetical protein